MRYLNAMLMAVLLSGCQTQGPFERAGKNVDNTIENVRDGTQDVIEDVRDGAEAVRDDVKRKR